MRPERRSQAFSRLKTALPWVPVDTKLSKLDTLRLASSYIAYLRHLLTSAAPEEGGEDEEDGAERTYGNMVSNGSLRRMCPETCCAQHVIPSKNEAAYRRRIDDRQTGSRGRVA